MRRWTLRGQRAGVVVGLCMFALGAWEPLNDQYLRMMQLTRPWSWVGELTVYLMQGMGLLVMLCSLILAFVILPAAQGSFIGAVLWGMTTINERARVAIDARRITLTPRRYGFIVRVFAGALAALTFVWLVLVFSGDIEWPGWAAVWGGVFLLLLLPDVAWRAREPAWFEWLTGLAP